MENDGRFTEQEMRLIFERAGQAGADAAGDRRYSLAELQDIAAQVGLDATDIARAATGLHGELRVVPGGMEWQAQSAMGQIIIDFVRANNGTRVEVLVAREIQAMVTVLGTGMAGLIAGLIAGLSVASLHIGAGPVLGAAIVAGVGSAWMGTRLIWSRVARRWAREPDALTQAVSEPVEQRPDETKAR